MKSIITSKFFLFMTLAVIGLGLILIQKNLLDTKVFLGERNFPGDADVELSSPSSVTSNPGEAESQDGNFYSQDEESSSIPENVAEPTKEFTRGDTKIIHFHFQEASDVNLLPMAGFTSKDFDEAILLHEDALGSMNKLMNTAKSEGIAIIPLSGFRTVEQQTFLFNRAIERHGSEFDASYLSAPPGYSEHHTGFAIDVGDGDAPQTHLKYAFENTKAYAWMLDHAAEFGFELSFPKGNFQGISFEPWHWRYVGTEKARALFRHVRE